MNQIVSVRIPREMFDTLKAKAHKDHFLDVSEAVRGIVRRRWLAQKDPQLYKMDQLRTDITDILKTKTEARNRELILAELEKIKEGLMGK